MRPLASLRRPEVSWTLAVLTLFLLVLYLGSHGFRELKVSELGYLIGTAFFIGGSTYRLAFFLGRPQARMYLKGALRELLKGRRRSLATAARGTVTNVVAQDFIWRRSWFRWLLHFNISWGCLLSFAITFPLVFGWVRFDLIGQTHYQMVVWGLPLFSFPIESLTGWLIFKTLNFSALMVVLGVGLAYYKRYRAERDLPGVRSDWDMLPLHLLFAVAATGLLLTVSNMFFRGAGYTVITLSHQVLVVLLLAYIPFSKLFHFLFRPLAVAVMVYHEAGAAEPQRCRSCGEPYAPARQVADLKRVLGEKGYSQPVMGPGLQPVRDVETLDLCPACKREYRVRRYVAEYAYQGGLFH